MKQPKLDKDADAEALLWEVRVTDEANGEDVHAIQNHYIRIKIFTERGRDKYSTVDISYAGRNRVSDIAGRTIKANGEIVELKKDAVFERMVAKTGGLKVKAKSFAMPAVEPGSIIEYRWKESFEGQLTNYIRLQFQRDIPVHLVRYYVKPFNNPYFPFGMRSMGFHAKFLPFAKEKGDFYMTYLENIPAFHEEPDMPAHADVRPWMLIFYSRDEKLDPAKYWEKVGKDEYNAYKSQVKISDELRKAAEEVTSGLSSPEEKAQKLFDYVRKDFKNTDFSDEVSNQDRAKIKQNKNSADTFRQRAGDSYELSLVYIALATAVNIEARLARSGDRDFGWFDKNFTDKYFLHTYNVAVKIGDKWKFCDPATRFTPFGMLRHQEEAEPALVSDPKEPFFTTTSVSSAEDSFAERTGTFELDAEGTLEGDIQTSYTGHSAVVRKWNYKDQTPAEREESVKESAKNRFGEAEVSNIKLESADDPLKPLKVSYHVKVPNYAQRTGRRLFLKMSYFQRDFKPRFTEVARKYPVVFDYPWSEHDKVLITLPAGYELEKPEAPSPLSLGGVGEYGVSIKKANEGKALLYDRTLTFGKNTVIEFPVSSYPLLKQAFEWIQERDDHVITLKQSQAGGN